MAITVSTYNHTSAKLLKLGVDPQAANFFLELLNGDATFVASHTTKAAVDNTGGYEVYGNGWTQGGENLASVAVTTVTTNDAMLDAADVQITATGGSIGPADAALVYVDEDGGGTYTPLWFIDFGESKTATVGNVFPVFWNASGIAQVTVA